MRTLSVIGVEDGAILAADENGERFRIPVDESVRTRLAVTSLPPGKRLSPKEIQAQVRAGLSVEEVAGRTGTPVAYVERFVRPVLAERSFVLESAMRVTVQPDADAGQASSFGAVLAERLAALDATDVTWTSFREPGGDWIVSVSFRADDLDHRARWTFDPKRLVLTPENVEAATLSQQGTPTALTPRLRALEPTGPVPVSQPAAPAEEEPDRSRFDSAAFELPADLDARTQQQGPVEASVLLDALARKRIERESASADPARVVREPDRDEAAGRTGTDTMPFPDAAPTAGTVTRARFTGAAVEREPAEAEPTASMEDEDDIVAFRRPRERGRRPEPQRRPEAQPRPQAQPSPRQPQQARQTPTRQSQPRHADREAAPARPVAPAGGQRQRRGRTSLPSWDEIVFGKAED